MKIIDSLLILDKNTEQVIGSLKITSENKHILQIGDKVENYDNLPRYLTVRLPGPPQVPFLKPILDYMRMDIYEPIEYIKRNTGISQCQRTFFIANPEFNKEIWYPFQNRIYTSLLNKGDIVNVDKYGMMRCNRHHIHEIPEFLKPYNKGDNITMEVFNLTSTPTSDLVSMIGIFKVS